jgi:biotin synthase
MYKGITAGEALDILNIDAVEEFREVLKETTQIRRKLMENKVEACSIINARCGGCSEDCAFCAQSKRSNADIDFYPLLDADSMYNYAEKIAEKGVSRIGIVTSGRSVEYGTKELEIICNAVQKITTNLNIKPCASLGLLDKKALKALKAAGLKRFHNNLETSESFFPEICSTRSYGEQINTIRTAKSIGLEVCCGGIFGLGESKKQRIEMLEAIRKLDIDSVPINFFTPIPGTPLEKFNDISPLDCLKVIAAATLMMPDKIIRVCGGREYNLKDDQYRIFEAGAAAFMTGGYLVTPGRSLEEDLEMLKNISISL